MLQYLQNETAQDSWFLLLISAIKAQLRLVGDSTNFVSSQKPVAHSRGLICNWPPAALDIGAHPKDETRYETNQVACVSDVQAEYGVEYWP